MITVTTKKGPAEKLDVNVFDHTAEATLTLWNALTPSTALWKPAQTILLLKSPSFKSERRPILFITGDTHVDVDPNMRDADWLRDYAQKLTKREHVNPEFPENGTAVRDWKKEDSELTPYSIRSGGCTVGTEQDPV